jgi:hypothetical protein
VADGSGGPRGAVSPLRAGQACRASLPHAVRARPGVGAKSGIGMALVAPRQVALAVVQHEQGAIEEFGPAVLFMAHAEVGLANEHDVPVVGADKGEAAGGSFPGHALDCVPLLAGGLSRRQDGRGGELAIEPGTHEVIPHPGQEVGDLIRINHVGAPKEGRAAQHLGGAAHGAKALGDTNRRHLAASDGAMEQPDRAAHGQVASHLVGIRFSLPR